MYSYMYIYIYILQLTHMHIYIYTYIYIHTNTCVCVCLSDACMPDGSARAHKRAQRDIDLYGRGREQKTSYASLCRKGLGVPTP